MEDAYKLKTISYLLSKDVNDMAGVPHPCQYIDLCRYDPTEICDESTQWLKALDMKMPIWSRLYLSNCVGHSRELSCTKERNYNIEIPQRLYSLWGSTDTHSLVFEKMWRLERYQWVCNVLICCAALKYNLNEWSASLLDDIVYRGSLIFAELCQTHKIINREFRFKHMNTLMQFRNTYYRILIEEKAKGFVYIPYGFNEYNLARALKAFFRFYQFGILECRQRCLAFGFATDVDQGYFMYDCQCTGAPFLDDNQANACVLRTNHLQILLYCITVALNVSMENVTFKIFNVDVRIEDPTERRVGTHEYVPTITRPGRVNGIEGKEIFVAADKERGLTNPHELHEEHKDLEKNNLISVDKRFKEINNTQETGIYNFKENNSKIDVAAKTVATLRETNQCNLMADEITLKGMPKMQQKIQDQGDFEVLLPIIKSPTKKSLLFEIEGKKTDLAERATAGEEKITGTAQIPDIANRHASPPLSKRSFISPAKPTATEPFKFGYRNTSPRDIKKIIESIYYPTANNQKSYLATSADVANVQDTHFNRQISANSSHKEPTPTDKQLNPITTNKSPQPQTDFKSLRKSIQITADGKFKSSPMTKLSEPSSFVTKRNQNATKLLPNVNNERIKPSLKTTESTETLKPSNSCTKTDLKLQVPLEKESFKTPNSYKDLENNRKSFSKNEKKLYNSNERMSFGAKLTTPKDRKSLPPRSINFPHSTGRKLSSPYGSKNQILPNQICDFKTRSDSGLIELYDVTKPNVLGLKVYLVNNRPQNGASKGVETIPKNIRIVKTMF